MDFFVGSGHFTCAYILYDGVRKRGYYIYVDFSLFVLLYNAEFIIKFKFCDFLKLKINIKTIDSTNSLIQYTKSSHFPLGGMIGFKIWCKNGIFEFFVSVVRLKSKNQP